MKKRAWIMVMAAAMAAAMTACGNSGSTTADTTAAETTAETTAAESKAEETSKEATADTSDKTWIIATDTAFKPFEYTDESGNFVGIDMDILKAVAEDQGFKYEVQVLGWDASIAACQAGQADGMIAGASITDERESSGWIFSDGYYDANQSMAVAESSDITGFDDLKGKKVAVKTASMSADYAESLKDEYGFEITYFEDSPTMYQAVVGGQAAACFDDTPIMASNIKDTGIAMKLVDGTGNDPAAYGFAVFDDSKKELIDLFNAGLKDIKENGTYDKIIAEYLGE